MEVCKSRSWTTKNNTVGEVRNTVEEFITKLGVGKVISVNTFIDEGYEPRVVIIVWYWEVQGGS